MSALRVQSIIEGDVGFAYPITLKMDLYVMNMFFVMTILLHAKFEEDLSNDGIALLIIFMNFRRIIS